MRRLVIILMFLLKIISYSVNLPRDIDIINMPLHDVVSILSKESGENIICSGEAKDIVIDTYFNKGENIDLILQGLAETYDLSIKKEKNMKILFLQKEEKDKKTKIIGVVSYDEKPLEGVKIELKDASRVAYSDKNGKFIIDNIPKNVYLCKFSKVGYEEKIEIIDNNKLINKLNVRLEKDEQSYISGDSNFYENSGKFLYTKCFNISNISTKEVEKVLKETFGDNIRVSTLEKVNKIVVNAERDVLDNVTSIICEIDREPKQVKITSQILDISNNLFQELGFDWIYTQNMESQQKSSLSAVLLGKASEVGGVPAVGSGLNIIRQFKNKNDILSFGMNLLEANNDLVVSSVPVLLISSGEEGEFKVTEEVVVGIKNERSDRKDRYRVSEPIFKEAGLIMKVKPFIKDDDYVILEISLELSDFKFKRDLLNLKEINSGTYNSEGGSKIGRSLKTKIRVKNGETILIGGLKKSIQQSIESKIPFFGDIPIINFFFKNTSKKNENSDMYIKITVDIENN